MQAKRALLLVMMFGLPLIPTVGQAGIPAVQEASPEAEPCTPVTDVFGRYLGAAEDGQRRDGKVLQLYRFTFSPLTMMPPEPPTEDGTYEETLMVHVEGDGFSLTISRGTATVIRPSGEREELDAGTHALDRDAVVLHQGGSSYSYANLGDNEASLAVGVVDDPSTPPDFQCTWCLIQQLWMIEGAEATPSSAKRIPSVMCKGG